MLYQHGLARVLHGKATWQSHQGPPCLYQQKRVTIHNHLSHILHQIATDVWQSMIGCRDEDGVQGGIIVQDCFELMNNLLRGNHGNQLMYR